MGPSCLVLSCLVFSRVRLRDRDWRRGSSTACLLAALRPPPFLSSSFYICPASTSLALIAPSSLDLRCSWLAPTLFSIAPGLRSSVFPCTHSPASVRGPCFRLVLLLSACALALGLWYLRSLFVPSLSVCGFVSARTLRPQFAVPFCFRLVPSLVFRGGLSRAFVARLVVGPCFRHLPSFSAFGFVLGFAFVISFCICFRLVLLLSVACLRCSCPLRVFPRFGLCPCSRLVSLLSACAFAFGLCLCGLCL
jgi:hypothetical protein